MTKKRSYWAAPVLVAAILLSVYAAYGLFPFGTGTISWCDMSQQVIPFLMNLKNILTGRSDMFLNLQNAGGMSFWGVFLFFVSSPFSFLVLFVGKAQIYSFVNILLLLKMVTCALTASGYFVRRFPNLSELQVTALSVLYAFCGYTMFYYQNIVWLDVMYLFPLLLIGLEKLAEEGKPLFYTLIFAAILTINFYLSYMVVVFLILAAGAWLFFCCERQKRKQRILLFGLSTIASGLLTGVVWLPSLLQYLASARAGDLISSLRMGTFIARLDTTFAVILCTGALGAAIVMALILRKHREPRIRMLFCLLAATLIPVFLEPINKMWQTGNYQSFPVRYGYMPVFLGLILLAVCIAAVNRETEPPRNTPSHPVSTITAVAAIAAVVFCATIILKYDFEEVTAYTRTLWGSSTSLKKLLLFATAVSLVYLILLLQYHYRRLSRTVFSVFLCALVVVEATFNSNIYIASADNNAQYYTPILDLCDRIQDSSLFRVKMDEKYFDVNLMGGMGYRSLSHYTSLTSRQYMFAMKKLGYSSYWMEVNSNGGTELTDALLGNEYSVVRTSAQYEGATASDSTAAGGETVYANGLYSIVKNKNALPIGLVMKSSNIASLADLPDISRLRTQQYLFQSVFSSDEQMFVQYEPTSLNNVNIKKTDRYEITVPDLNFDATVTYRIPVQGTQTLYFDCFDQLTNNLYEHINSSFSITVNGKLLNIEYPTQSENGLYRLGTFTDQTVVVEIGILRNVYAKSFGVAGLKEDVLSSAVSSAQKASLHQSGNSIVGTASADGDDEYLFLPVNYAKGYTATVNGKPAAISRVFDTFLAVKLEKGINQISVSYVPDGFLLGLLLTLCGVVFVVLLEFFRRRGKLERMKKMQTVFNVLFWTIFAAAAVLIYLFPILVYFA
jgi:uncharacterized membrane protein YfhO